uniref:Uncharacterized protein n=1 Tax=Arundo donax TaxID=35708 RepID=A0A0A8ZIP0_ARUDO
MWLLWYFLEYLHFLNMCPHRGGLQESQILDSQGF